MSEGRHAGLLTPHSPLCRDGDTARRNAEYAPSRTLLHASANAAHAWLLGCFALLTDALINPRRPIGTGCRVCQSTINRRGRSTLCVCRRRTRDASLILPHECHFNPYANLAGRRTNVYLPLLARWPVK